MQTPEVLTVTLNPAIDRKAVVRGFSAGAVNRVETSRDQAGGKGVNVASSLCAHGHPASVTGLLGEDNAEVFNAHFANLGIDDRFVRLPGRTRVGIKILDTNCGDTTDINFPGLQASADALSKVRQRILDFEGSWCVLAGSLPPGVSAEIYAEWVSLAKSQGLHTLLDASGEALRLALYAAPDVIKPNVHELEELLGERLPTVESVVAAAAKLVAKYAITLVVVSLGAEGACFVTRECALLARPPVIQVGSTVGAGDAMVAGIVAGHLRDLALPEIARVATRFSLEVVAAAPLAEAPEITIENLTRL